MQKAARLNLCFLAEIDQFSVEAVARSAPSVFVQKPTTINAKRDVLPKQLVKSRNHSLGQGRDRQRVVDARLRIAYPHFQRVEEGMQANVPPNFLRVIDATGFHQELAVIFVFGK